MSGTNYRLHIRHPKKESDLYPIPEFTLEIWRDKSDTMHIHLECEQHDVNQTIRIPKGEKQDLHLHFGVANGLYDFDGVNRVMFVDVTNRKDHANEPRIKFNRKATVFLHNTEPEIVYANDSYRNCMIVRITRYVGMI